MSDWDDRERPTVPEGQQEVLRLCSLSLDGGTVLVHTVTAAGVDGAET